MRISDWSSDVCSSDLVAGARIGDASAVKMIRSVIVKGIEALTAEAMIAAERAGVTKTVLASLGGEWPAQADYNLERMLVHGLRRAAELDEVAITLDDLEIGQAHVRTPVTNAHLVCRL